MELNSNPVGESKNSVIMIPVSAIWRWVLNRKAKQDNNNIKKHMEFDLENIQEEQDRQE